jgi:aspartate racemase
LKTIGMIGGMSWESSAVYYRIINREVQKRLGGSHSAKTLMYSFDFEEMSALQHDGRWAEADDRMTTAAVMLEKGGADLVIICCNTMHGSIAPMVSALRVPLIHIADPLGAAIRKAGYKKTALLGSEFTMTQDNIVRGRLKSAYGIDVIVPAGADFAETSRVIYEELVRGKFLETSRKNYRDIIARLVARGADSIILGCTELPMLVKEEDSAVPLLDTATLHALAAVDAALG